MKITDLKPGKHGLMYLFLDDEFAFSLYPDLWHESRLRIGDEVEEAVLAPIKEKQDTLYARSRALDLLSRGDCTEKALFDKLIKRGIAPEKAAQAVAYCIEKGFLSDEALIEKYLPYLFETKKYGVRRVRQILAEKGFDKALADRALENYDADPLPALLALLEKEKRPPQDANERKKLIAKLMRKGFVYEDIRRALRQFSECDAEDLYE